MGNEGAEAPAVLKPISRGDQDKALSLFQQPRTLFRKAGGLASGSYLHRAPDSCLSAKSPI